MKNWLVATYKKNNLKKLEHNLRNQKFKYYLPKITIKKLNSSLREELIFPGYIFINTSIENYTALKYTLGIKSIVKFGNNIPCISNKDIESMQLEEKTSKIQPIKSKIQIGQDAIISNGSFKGSMVKICSLPLKERVSVLLTFLGSMRKVTISQKDLIY